MLNKRNTQIRNLNLSSLLSTATHDHGLVFRHCRRWPQRASVLLPSHSARPPSHSLSSLRAPPRASACPSARHRGLFSSLSSSANHLFSSVVILPLFLAGSRCHHGALWFSLFCLIFWWVDDFYSFSSSIYFFINCCFRASCVLRFLCDFSVKVRFYLILVLFDALILDTDVAIDVVSLILCDFRCLSCCAAHAYSSRKSSKGWYYFGGK